MRWWKSQVIQMDKFIKPQVADGPVPSGPWISMLHDSMSVFCGLFYSVHSCPCFVTNSKIGKMGVRDGYKGICLNNSSSYGSYTDWPLGYIWKLVRVNLSCFQDIDRKWIWPFLALAACWEGLCCSRPQTSPKVIAFPPDGGSSCSGGRCHVLVKVNARKGGLLKGRPSARLV